VSEEANFAKNRSLPWAAEAEKAVLCSALLDPPVMDDLSVLRPDHFYWAPHRLLWRELQEMRNADHPIDMVTVTQRLHDKGLLEDAGGGYAVTDIATFIPSSGNVQAYFRTVMEKAARRKIIEVGNKMVRSAYDESDSTAEELLHVAETALVELRNEADTKEALRPLKEAVIAAATEIENLYLGRGRIRKGLATGFVDFDRMTGGLEGGQMVVIAGRPGAGKSVFMQQVSREFSEQGPVVIFSLEMSSQQLANRYIASEARISLQRIRDGFMKKPDFNRLPDAVMRLARSPIFVDDTPELRLLDFRARARRAVAKYGARVIIVDYLQLLKSTTKQAQMSRHLEVAEISRAMKVTAKELDVPVICLAQLNRDAETASRAPRLSDLRESGQIEGDADIVGMLHRPNKDSEDENEKKRVQLMLVKHRDGAPGTIELIFHGEEARFQNVTEKLYSNNKNERQKNYE
jgi:replicative DNA helicase